jgi:Protein of unknown function (DUF4235)
MWIVCNAMKLLYKPFSLIASLIAARIGKALFRALWSSIDTAEPPEPTAPEASMTKVVGAAALEAATMATVTAAVDRTTATAFHHLFGVWPGEEPERKS